MSINLRSHLRIGLVACVDKLDIGENTAMLTIDHAFESIRQDVVSPRQSKRENSCPHLLQPSADDVTAAGER